MINLKEAVGRQFNMSLDIASSMGIKREANLNEGVFSAEEATLDDVILITT